MSKVTEHMQSPFKKFPNDSFEKLKNRAVVDDIELKYCIDHLLYFRMIRTRLSCYFNR